MGQKDADGMANSVDPDQTAPQEQFDVGIHCLPRSVSLKTYDQYGSLTIWTHPQK